MLKIQLHSKQKGDDKEKFWCICCIFGPQLVMHCRHKLRRTRLLGRGSFLLFLVIFIFPYVMSVSFHKFSKAKEIIKKEKDQRFANAGCSFGLSYQEAQSCLHQHNVGLFVVHISLVWLLFCLNLVFKFVILCSEE